MKFLTNDKVELDYHKYGQGQPVVLVEGFGGYQEIWRLQVDYLTEMNCQVITYDHRNHGHSQRTDKGLQMDRLTDDLSELINYLYLDKPILVGHSMGASICYDYLSRYQNIKALMAIDQSPKTLNDSNWKYGFENLNANNLKKKLSESDKAHETVNGLDNRIVFDLNEAKTKYPFNRISNLPLLLDHAQKDWRKVLLKTQIPIDLVVAKQSPYFNCNFAKKLAGQNSFIKQYCLENCGHDIMAEVPDEFNQTLRHFIFRNLKK